MKHTVTYCRAELCVNEKGGTCSASLFLSSYLSTHVLDWFEAPDQISFSRPPRPVSIVTGSGDEIESCVPTLINSDPPVVTSPRAHEPSSPIEKRFANHPYLYAVPIPFIAMIAHYFWASRAPPRTQHGEPSDGS